MLAEMSPAEAAAIPLGIFYIILCIFAILLVISPLMIWLNLRKMRGEVAEAFRIMRHDHGKLSAEVKRAADLLTPTDQTVACPKCGGIVHPNANGTARCDACGTLLRVER